ncbi:MAG: hypothetical protein OFPII_01190 [Osedax symbiont Rs1]|nr:MAG: hypothetical protein OFPII_01190 [Osedax symbiont Rs1]
MTDNNTLKTLTSPLPVATLKTVMRVINLSWGPNKSSTLLNKLNFNIQKNEILGIVGANGAGKSSLLRCLYRVHKPSEGYIYLAEQDIWKLTPQIFSQQVAVVLQESPAEFSLTVKQIIEMGRTPYFRLFGSINNSDDAIINEIIEQLSLAPFINRVFTELSGGEKQRVYLARALAQQPDILILDEPTNHLDIRHQLEIMQLISNLGITIIITLHDLNLAANFCDNILLLHQGQLLAHGKTVDILTPPLIKQAYGVNCTVNYHHKSNTHQFQYSLQ